MQLIQRNKDSAYLQYDKYVNYDNPIVAAKAKELAADCKSSDEIIQACYYFVRDSISHTYDSNFSVITISASDVLEASTGISYSKANLLAALLVPTTYIQDSAISVSSTRADLWLCMHLMRYITQISRSGYVLMPVAINTAVSTPITHIMRLRWEHVIDSAAGEYEFNDLIAVPLPSTMRVLEQSTNFYKMYFNDMPDYDA